MLLRITEICGQKFTSPLCMVHEIRIYFKTHYKPQREKSGGLLK